MTEEEIIVEERDEHPIDVIKWVGAGFGVGLLVGGIVGLLMAPKAGKDSRDQLKSFTSDLSDKTQKLARDLGERASTTKEAITQSYKAGKSKYDEMKSDD